MKKIDKIKLGFRFNYRKKLLKTIAKEQFSFVSDLFCTFFLGFIALVAIVIYIPYFPIYLIITFLVEPMMVAFCSDKDAKFLKKVLEDNEIT